MDMRERALQALLQRDPDEKAAAVTALHEACLARSVELQPDARLREPVDEHGRSALPGRPNHPRLVAPRDLPQRSPQTPLGHAALIHSVAHIEFNAINLALDAVWRFAGLPADFYADWLRVAREEALHFSLLQAHLRTLGHTYGDFDAHDGLWMMTARTADDVLARMALVPRLLEARGLDATPPMQARLARAGDRRAVEILALILRDEVGHVEVGNRWYRHLCAQRGLDPLMHFRSLATQYGAPRLKPPFNLEARRRAGFPCRLWCRTPSRATPYPRYTATNLCRAVPISTWCGVATNCPNSRLHGLNGCGVPEDPWCVWSSGQGPGEKLEPAWEDCDVQIDVAAQIEPDWGPAWDGVAQPAPKLSIVTKNMTASVEA